jgi:hypothetical protein
VKVIDVSILGDSSAIDLPHDAGHTLSSATGLGYCTKPNALPDLDIFWLTGSYQCHVIPSRSQSFAFFVKNTNVIR